MLMIYNMVADKLIEKESAYTADIPRYFTTYLILSGRFNLQDNFFQILERFQRYS